MIDNFQLNYNYFIHFRNVYLKGLFIFIKEIVSNFPTKLTINFYLSI